MEDHWQLKLFFDGKCPLCSREVAVLRRLNRRHRRLAFQDITSPDFDPACYGLTMDDVMGSMHAVRRDGSVVRAMDVFREAYRAVGLGWILAPTNWPVLRSICDVLYRGFARVRPRLSPLSRVWCGSGGCGLERPSAPSRAV